jgi:aldose 1-epimerase
MTAGWRSSRCEDALLRTRMSSGLRRLVVFTQPARDFIAIEPVSHVNNAINRWCRRRGSQQALGVQHPAARASRSAPQMSDRPWSAPA